MPFPIRSITQSLCAVSFINIALLFVATNRGLTIIVVVVVVVVVIVVVRVCGGEQLTDLATPVRAAPSPTRAVRVRIALGHAGATLIQGHRCTFARLARARSARN